jgi:hypothetical protein
MMERSLATGLWHRCCLQVALDRVLFRNSGPAKDPIQVGGTAACEVPNGDLLVGGGDGSVSVLRTALEPNANNPKVLKKMGRVAALKLEGGVASITLEEVQGRAFTFLVGTTACNIYRLTYEPLSGK